MRNSTAGMLLVLACALAAGGCARQPGYGVPYLGSLPCREARGEAPRVWSVSPGGEVRGRVADENGDAIARAQVSLRRDVRGRGYVMLQAATDSTGAFTLAGVSPGRWDAAVLHLGHAAFRRRVEIRPGSDTVRARLEVGRICLVA